MNLFKWVNYFFCLVFTLDLILIVFTIISELINKNRIYSLEWLVAYTTFFVIIPSGILFLVFLLYMVVKQENYSIKDYRLKTTIYVFLTVIILTISYSIYLRP